MDKELIHPWPFPQDMKNIPYSFTLRSKFAVSMVGTWSKILLCKFNLINIIYSKLMV